MRAVVTGANGHLGATLCNLLLQENHHVRAGIRKPHTAQRINHVTNRAGAELVDYDLTDMASLCRLMKDADVVFHAAAPTQLWSQKATDLSEPIYQGTLNIIAAAAQERVEKIIHTSSCAAVGFHAPSARSLNESDFNHLTCHPQFQSKLRAEIDGEALAKRLGLHFIRTCPPSILGPGFNTSTPSTEPYFLLLRGQLPAIPNLSYHVIDVRDLAKAQILLALNDPYHDRYIIAGEYMTPAKLLHTLADIDAKLSLPKMVLPNWMLPFLAIADLCAYYLRFGKTTRRLTWDLAIECGNSEQRLSCERFSQEFPQWRARDTAETLRDTLHCAKRLMTERVK